MDYLNWTNGLTHLCPEYPECPEYDILDQTSIIIPMSGEAMYKDDSSTTMPYNVPIKCTFVKLTLRPSQSDLTDEEYTILNELGDYTVIFELEDYLELIEINSEFSYLKPNPDAGGLIIKDGNMRKLLILWDNQLSIAGFYPTYELDEDMVGWRWHVHGILGSGVNPALPWISLLDKLVANDCLEPVTLREVLYFLNRPAITPPKK